MTESDTILLIGKIKTMYIKELNGIDDDVLCMMIEAWQEMLEDLTLDQCMSGLKRHSAISKWSPTIADIREQATKIENNELSAADSWNKCFKIALNLQHYESWDLERFELDDIEKRCLLSVGISEIKNSEKIAIERSNFMRMFNEMNEKRIMESKMPKALRLENIKALRQSEKKLLNSNADNNTISVIESIESVRQNKTKSDKNYYQDDFFYGIKSPIEKMRKVLKRQLEA